MTALFSFYFIVSIYLSGADCCISFKFSDIIILMLFQDEVPEDKGLFTFYREQAERQEQIKREKKLRKKRKEEEGQAEAMNLSIPKQITQQNKPDPIKHFLLPKTINTPRQPHPPTKPRASLPKQRLIESIVDMGKDIDPEPQQTQRQLVTLRHRQASHILRSRRYKQKPGEEVQQMMIGSLHRRNQSEELRPKQVIHCVRGSAVQLPEIRKPQEGKMPYRPKKSLKSKLIQDALLSRDRDKIRQIRNYLKAQSPIRQWQGEGQEQDEGQGFEVFEFRQQKLLAVLKRFRRV